MPCASRSHPLAIAIAISMTRRPTRTPPNPSAAVAVLPATSRSQFQFECRKRTPVKLIRFRFICKKTSLGERIKAKREKKRRLIFRGGFVHNLRTMLCTPLTRSAGLCEGLQAAGSRFVVPFKPCSLLNFFFSNHSIPGQFHTHTALTFH